MNIEATIQKHLKTIIDAKEEIRQSHDKIESLEKSISEMVLPKPIPISFIQEKSDKESTVRATQDRIKKLEKEIEDKKKLLYDTLYDYADKEVVVNFADEKRTIVVSKDQDDIYRERESYYLTYNNEIL